MSKRRIHDLETPALLLDLPTVECNLLKMARFISRGRTALRPHFKNHQSVWLSARQPDAGAIGITCATVEQAETLAHHGVGSILIASEVVSEAKLGRLAELARQADVMVAIDHARAVADVARIARIVARLCQSQVG